MKKKLLTAKALALLSQTKPLLKNSLTTGTVFYGLHMTEGVAHYKQPIDDDSFTVMVPNQTIMLANSTFGGKPVYVGHVDEHTLLSEADGVVSESFYNKADGAHWCKFVVTTQKGLDAIARGWTLSNSLVVDKHSAGGEWHGLNYDRNVDAGTFHHLAIVPNPRYAESVIMTPAEFKLYNQSKEAEFMMLANSKEKQMFFKKTKLDNTKELQETMVTLPKKKRDVSIQTLINEADEAPAASDDAEIDIDGKKMTLSAFIELYKKLKAEFDSLEIVEEEEEEMLSNSKEGEEEEEDNDLDESGDMEEEEEGESDLSVEDQAAAELEAEDAALAEGKKLDNGKKAVKKVATNGDKKKNVKKLNNAADRADLKVVAPSRVVDLSSDKIMRGQQRYGSSKK